MTNWYDKDLEKLKTNKTKINKIKKEAESFSLDKLKDFCSYDGACQLSEVLADEFGFAFCDGEHCGEIYCPLTKILKEFELVKKDKNK